MWWNKLSKDFERDSWTGSIWKWICKMLFDKNFKFSLAHCVHKQRNIIGFRSLHLIFRTVFEKFSHTVALIPHQYYVIYWHALNLRSFHWKVFRVPKLLGRVLLRICSNKLTTLFVPFTRKSPDDPWITEMFDPKGDISTNSAIRLEKKMRKKKLNLTANWISRSQMWQKITQKSCLKMVLKNRGFLNTNFRLGDQILFIYDLNAQEIS